MKIFIRSLLLIQIFLLLNSNNLDAQTFTWVKTINSFHGDIFGKGTAIDTKGNSYITGYFQDTAVFGTTNLMSRGIYDIYLAKYDHDGTCLWARQAGGSDWDQSYSISVDDNTNCYVTGYFTGTATFGQFQITSNGISDIFIAKYDPSGNCLWVKQAGGPSWDYGMHITVDAKGNSYLIGYFYEAATFGTFHLTSYGGSDIFIAKYDPDGNCLWAKQAGGTTDDWGYGISIDKNGNSYITGDFTGTATFGTIQLTSFESFNMFIAKYDADGNCLWVKQNSKPNGMNILVDASGNIYVTGTFIGTATFGTIQLSSYGDNDIYIAKYDSDGNCIWAKQAGGSSDDFSYGISIDANKNCYITGYFYGTVVFGAIQLDTYGGPDIFIAKYGPDGNCLWAKNAGSSYWDEGASIAIDTNGDCFITGHYCDGALFDKIQLSGYGAYIAKLSNSPVAINDAINPIPTEYSLYQNYPNPYNPTCTINYSIVKEGNVKLTVYNSLGSKVVTLLNEYKPAGNYSVNFNAGDLPSGIYFYRLEAGQFSQVKKMMLMK